jgi:hypothetical protein
LPYSAEYSGAPADVGFLRQLAQATDGSVLTVPADSFAHNLRLAESARPVWPYLIAFLVPLFLLDVALRRLRLKPSDLAPVFERVGDRWRGQTGRAAALAYRLRVARQTTRPAAPRPVLRPTVVAARRAAAPTPTYRSTPRAAAVAQVPDAPAGNRLLNAKRRATPPARAGRG